MTDLATELRDFQPTCRRGEGFADGLEVRDDWTLTGRAVPYGKWVQLGPTLLERYEPGVFARQTRDPARVKICLEHGQIIGRCVNFDERDDGLHFVAKISTSEDIPEARKARAMLADDLADELSVGFRGVSNGTVVDTADGMTRWQHNRAQLLEISLVPWGAMGRDATVTRAVFWEPPAVEPDQEPATPDARTLERQWLAEYRAGLLLP